MAGKRDYYEILGLSKGASDEELKRAYRALAHKHHPDKTGGDEAKFKEINEAYQVLGDAKKRAQYDQFGHAAEQMGGFGGGQGFGGFGGFNGQNFDMGDISEMFGDVFGFGGGRRQSASGARKGGDIEMTIRLTFHEAAFGTEKALELYKPSACAHCSGAGVEPGSKMIQCKTCRGQGRVRQVQRTILGNFESIATCSDCGGAGNVPEKQCGECKGTGVRKQNKTIKVKIPGGINDGETIRIRGEGEAGSRGGRAGDLFLHMNVAPDAHMTRKGADVHSNLEITFSEAALGTTKEINTLDGELEVKIPAGVQTGEEVRLKTRGAERLQASGRGDHYVHVVVRTPKGLSRKAKEILENLRDEGL